jgi:hypothetical protein
MAEMYILIVVLVVAGCLLVRLDSRRVLKRTCAELRVEFKGQIDALSAKLTAVERTVEGQTATAPSAALATGTMRPPADTTSPQVSEEITPEALARIAETITALLGRKVRIRSVKILHTHNVNSSSWAQQGRVVVQASHNIAQRGRE